MINILTDVGGVTFTFDKELRKEIWIREAGDLVRGVLADRASVTHRYSGLTVNPYAAEFDLGQDFNSEFSAYARAVAETVGLETSDPAFAERAGREVLKGMLLDPTTTALLEYIQGEVLKLGELVAEPVDGIHELISYVVGETGGVFRGYSTGAAQMPDQFHEALGLDKLVGNVRTTFPEYTRKHKQPQQILEEARRLRRETGQIFTAFIDDQENEVGLWAQARNLTVEEELGCPILYLFKPDVDDGLVGTVETGYGAIVVVNKLSQIKDDLSNNAPYLRDRISCELDFKNDPKKFG
jgi:hypothetical protein